MQQKHDIANRYDTFLSWNPTKHPIPAAQTIMIFAKINSIFTSIILVFAQNPECFLHTADPFSVTS